MKGIVLAGGSGTRLHPATTVLSKQLIPIYDKPMIFYPLSILMMAGIREILIISTPRDTPTLRNLFGTGEKFGIQIEYAIQELPNGIAEAFVIGKDFIGDDSVALILGDNLFYGNKLIELITEIKVSNDAVIFGYHVKHPENYGVLEFDANRDPISIQEKPDIPRSSYAVPGLYFYPNDVVSRVNSLTPSLRGELEITSLNMNYLKSGNLKVEIMPRGVAWLDTGTPDDLLSASNFVQAIEQRQGYKIACLEEIAFRKGYLTFDALMLSLENYPESPYKSYIIESTSLDYRTGES
jgi:glucose-1-phosphate thymidylyltransferase